MKSLLPLALLVLLPVAPAEGLVSVTLDVSVAGYGYKQCDVAVPAEADGGAVLDAAVASGCLVLWTHDSYPGWGRYVVCIDVLCGAGPTYWAMYVNHGYASVGIDGYTAQDGDTLGFDYQQWVL